MNTNNNCPNCRKWVVLFSIACAVVVILTIALTVLITQRVSTPSVLTSSVSQTSVNPVSSETPSELLLKYADSGESSLLETLLKQNPSIDINRPRAEGNKTALYLACEKGYTDIVKLLIDRNADRDICDAASGSLHDAMRYTPLTVASRNGHCDVVKVLLSSGVDIESRDGSNRTALYSAAGYNQPSVVQLLCEKKANVNNVGRHRMTPLDIAIRMNYMEVVKILLKSGDGINLEKRNQLDRTLLCEAVDKNNSELVRLLCEAGAKVNVRCRGGTPLTMAAYKGYVDIIHTILKYGKDVDVNMTDDGYQKSTPLFHAALNGQAEAVRVLCDAGADLNVRGGPFHKTPIEIASDQRHDNVVKVLKELQENRQKKKQTEESSRSKLDNILK